MKFLMKIISTILVLSFPLLANSVATITAIKGNVQIQSASVEIKATLGASLEKKDSVITKSKSKVQIVFNDETIVTIGKDSHFFIENYLFDETHEPIVEFALLKGAMRTITGKIGKIAPQKFKVRTKTATIGIRGTNFVVVVEKDGTQKAYCTYGAISVTINKEEHIVKQGFYLELSSNGEIGINKFSSDELKEMDTKNFGDRKPLKGTGLYKDVQLDNTIEKFEDIVVKDVSVQIQDAVQTAKEIDSLASGITMSGFSIDNDSQTDLTVSVSYTFAQDGISFDSTVSGLNVDNKLNDAGYGGEYDNWSFQLASTPHDFTSKDEFITSFSSVYLDPQNSSTSKDAQLITSSFSTATDLANDDYMTWGQWSAEVDYTYIDSSIGSQQIGTHYFQGLWVTGEVTEISVVAALAGTVQYIGQYNAIDILNSNSIVSGDATMFVDFGTNRDATLQLSYENGDSSGVTNYTLSIIGNGLSGTQDSGPGTVNGIFYGPNGESIGGNFSSSTPDSISDAGLKGVYQVTAPVQ